MFDVAMLEAMILLEGNLIEEKKIATILGMNVREVREVIQQLQYRVANDINTGIAIAVHNGTVSLVPKPFVKKKLETYYNRNIKIELSIASLETLSIIAYKQPIIRSKIEEIRGVSVDNNIRMLKNYNLIKVVGKANKQALLYGTTDKFLSLLMIRNISELPNLDKNYMRRFVQRDYKRG